MSRRPFGALPSCVAQRRRFAFSPRAGGAGVAKQDAQGARIMLYDGLKRAATPAEQETISFFLEQDITRP